MPRSLRDINITGGEPFLREDVAEIVAILHEACGTPRQIFSTNGLAPKLIQQRLKEIIRTNAQLAVRISIHGIGPRHDEVMGVPGAYQRAMETIEALRESGLNDLGVAFTASNNNIDQLLDIYSLSRQLDMDFTFCGIAHNSEIYFGTSNQQIENKGLFEKHIMGMVRRDLTSRHVKKWLRAFYGMGVYRHAFTGSRRVPCGAAENFFWMNSLGDIFPDMVLNRKLGNIKEQTFEEIWHGEPARKFREELRTEGCATPCWMSCTVVPFMKQHKFEWATWLVLSKIRAHLGIRLREPVYKSTFWPPAQASSSQ